MAISYTRLLQFYQQFGRFYARQFAPLLAQSGLSMREMNVLLFLSNNPGYDTARDVTEFRGLSKSQVSQAVELLAAQGLLHRRPDGTDRRIVHLALAEEALPLARRAQAVQSACAARLFSGFSPEESEQFQAFLERVLDNGDALAEEGGR
ncbi:MarR family winged helix-turn-helix transcriptional regulator [uncultured Oscillibacter sp.]|uniref:MarR family winged helix-turn-helix transcriptional regulator n=1 Tax=uncultured Oscillibacter sp. TaxID=876091 RepID=UPI0025E4AF12|nr:MarR family transcriptional regulator [uncultured Oscillibacter sp.]